MSARRAAVAPLVLLYALALASCATERTSGPGAPQVSPAARYNLGGYSAAFKEGYADACASPRRRSEQRFKSDMDYQMGWNDGSSMCRR